MRLPFNSVIDPGFKINLPIQYYPAETFPLVNPANWLISHFAVGGWSPLKRLSGMFTAHMTHIAPHNGFTWHPHRGLEIYTWVLDGALTHEDTTGGQGVIQAGEFQRMFSGEWIEHQELNQTDIPTRVIQIWFAALPEYQHLAPHYQQVTRDDLPARRVDAATVYSLIGNDAPMDHHVNARLTATTLDVGGTTTIEAPHADEDLFLYVTDGLGTFTASGLRHEIGLYDVMLIRPSADPVELYTPKELRYLSFYLPPFLD